MSKKYGKTIRLFLIDGVPKGKLTCELSNWTGKAYKIPRYQLKELSGREELKRPGVYMLFGKDNEEKSVYIGEAENVYDRLRQHLGDPAKDFWSEVILFISKDDNLNKAHIKYLENRMYQLAKKANIYKVMNNSIPQKSSISEPDEAEMEEFLDNIRLLTNTLGHNVFETISDEIKNQLKKEKIFFLSGPRGADAKGLPTAGGFTVLKGSKIANDTVPSTPKKIIELRKQLINRKILEQHDDGSLVMLEDYEFSSPSAAAAVVLGRSANGLMEWKLHHGTTLKEIEKTDS